MTLPEKTEKIFEMLSRDCSKEEITERIKQIDIPVKDHVRHTNTRDIVCPYCGAKPIGIWMTKDLMTRSIQCRKCGKKIVVPIFSPTPYWYTVKPETEESTRKKEE